MSYLPDLRDALVKAAQRQQTLAANDQKRSGRSSGPWSRARGQLRPTIGGVATVLATVTTIAVVAVALTAIRHSGSPSTKPGGAQRAPGSDANDSAARAAAKRLLTESGLPVDAVKSGLVPGTPAALWSPSDRLGTAHLVDVHRVWRLHEGPGEAIRFIEAHRPPGSQIGSGSSAGSGRPGSPEVIQMETVVLNFPGNPKTVIWRELAIDAVALQAGGTALRVDAEAGWLAPRPSTERIPGGADRLQVTTSKRDSHHKQLRRTRVMTSPQRIQTLLTLLNALPAAQQGLGRCPNEPGLRLRFAFDSSSQANPLAVAAYDSYCSANVIRLQIGGRPQPNLQMGLPDGNFRRLSSELKQLGSFTPKLP